MEIIDVIGAAATVGSGGLLGVLGALSTRLFGYFERKAEQSRQLALAEMDHKHELALRDQDMAYMEREAALANQKIQLELSGKELDASLGALQASYGHDSDSINHDGHWLLIGAEFIRKIYRPLLTTFLFVLVYLFFQDAEVTVKDDIIGGVLALASCAGTWWFTDRSVQKGVSRNVRG